MCPFGIRGVTLWDTGFCFCGIDKQHSLPAVEVARRCDVSSFGIERRALGDSPMWRDALAVNAQAPPSRHGDEAVVLKFAEPALHRSCRSRAKIGRGFAVRSEDLSVVQIVMPQIASQNDVQTSRAKRQLLPRWGRQGRADQRDEWRQTSFLGLVLAHGSAVALCDSQMPRDSTNVRARSRLISLRTPSVLIARRQGRSNTSMASTSSGPKMS
jgi:hypothetical protein